MHLIDVLIFVSSPPGVRCASKRLRNKTVVHPLAIVGITGVIVNALNLMPIGSLDGGRIAMSTFGRKGGGVLGTVTLLLQVMTWYPYSSFLLFFFSSIFCTFFHLFFLFFASPPPAGKNAYFLSFFFAPHFPQLLCQLSMLFCAVYHVLFSFYV